MYCVYQNQGQGPIALGVTSLNTFYNLPLMKNLHYRFLRNYESYKVKLGIHMESGLLYCVYQNQGQGPITLDVISLDRLFNLPLMKIFCRTFLKNCKGNKVETWYIHVYGKWVDILCIPESEPRAHILMELNPFIGFTLPYNHVLQ